MAKKSKKTAKRTNGDGYLKQKKNGKWEGYTTLGHDAKGKPIRQYFTCDSRELALAKMQELTAQRMKGLDIDSYRLTMRDFLERWIAFKKRDLRATTFLEYSKIVKRFLTPHLGDILVTKLTPLQIESFITKLFDEGCTVATTRQIIKVLKVALNTAVQWNIVSISPAMRVKKPKAQPREIIVWQPSEVVQFLETSKPHRLYALFYLALSTGMRRGEVLGLRWEDIEGDVLTVKRSVVQADNKVYVHEPKTVNSKRRIYLSTDTVQVLREHRQRQEQGSPIVFPAENGNYFHPRNLLREFYALLKAAKVTKCRFHDLRHVHASMLIRNGVSPLLVSQRLGHSDPSITLNTYAHLYESEQRQSAIPLEKLLN